VKPVHAGVEPAHPPISVALGGKFSFGDYRGKQMRNFPSRALLGVKYTTTAFLITLAASVSSTTSQQPLDFGGQELVVLTWSEYLDPDVVNEFENKFNAKIKFAYYESDDSRTELLVAGEGKGYDVVLTSGLDVQKYVRQGWLEPKRNLSIPNDRHIKPRWIDAFPKTETHAMPYFWGTLGIAYRKDLVPKPITSWNDLLNPPEELRGKIVMNRYSRDLMAAALKALGHSINSNDRDELKAAENLLRAQKPYVKAYSYVVLTEESALVKGDIVASMIFNGDALMLQEHHPDIEYALPSEGGNIWVDYFAVLRASYKKELASAFLNFLNEPKIAARNAEFVNYATPNTAAEQYLPDEYFANPVIYPPEDQLSKSEFYKPLSPRAQKLTNSIIAQLIVGKTSHD
jgi:spermidine/putrescine transport system substrate-binding protein